MFRWLRSLFALAPPDRSKPGPPPRGFVPPSSFTAHEDCWGQQLLLPRANAALLAAEAARQSPGDQENAKSGFWEVYQPPTVPFPLSERCVSLAELLTAFAWVPGRHYQRVFVLSATGPERYFIPEACAFGGDDCALVVEAAGGVVQALWVADRSAWTTPRRLILQELLLMLGQRYDLVLLDWDALQLTDLANAEAVTRYVSPANPPA